jgi:hypothetical protein
MGYTGCCGAGLCFPVIEGTPDDALEVLLLMRSGSTMVGESRVLGRFRNISPSPRPCWPDALMAKN